MLERVYADFFESFEVNVEALAWQKERLEYLEETNGRLLRNWRLDLSPLTEAIGVSRKAVEQQEVIREPLEALMESWHELRGSDKRPEVEVTIRTLIKESSETVSYVNFTLGDSYEILKASLDKMDQSAEASEFDRRKENEENDRRAEAAHQAKVDKERDERIDKALSRVEEVSAAVKKRIAQKKRKNDEAKRASQDRLRAAGRLA